MRRGRRGETGFDAAVAARVASPETHAAEALLSQTMHQYGLRSPKNRVKTGADGSKPLCDTRVVSAGTLQLPAGKTMLPLTLSTPKLHDVPDHANKAGSAATAEAGGASGGGGAEPGVKPLTVAGRTVQSAGSRRRSRRDSETVSCGMETTHNASSLLTRPLCWRRVPLCHNSASSCRLPSPPPPPRRPVRRWRAPTCVTQRARSGRRLASLRR